MIPSLELGGPGKKKKKVHKGADRRNLTRKQTKNGKTKGGN